MNRVRMALVVLVASAGAAAQDAERGAAIAARWCASCHALDRPGSDAVPGFPALAARRAPDADWLRRALLAPHPQMPPVPLSTGELADLAAFLAALRAVAPPQ